MPIHNRKKAVHSILLIFLEEETEILVKGKIGGMFYDDNGREQ